MVDSVAPSRKIRCAFYKDNSKVISSESLQLKAYLQHLGDIELEVISTLGAATSPPYDLVAIEALGVPEEAFAKWLFRLSKTMQSPSQIWTPAVITANLSFKTLQQVFTNTVYSNWYFDIIGENEKNSIPIRVANLLRIRDHLYELRRYKECLDDLEERTDRLELQLKTSQEKNS